MDAPSENAGAPELVSTTTTAAASNGTAAASGEDVTLTVEEGNGSRSIGLLQGPPSLPLVRNRKSSNQQVQQQQLNQQQQQHQQRTTIKVRHRRQQRQQRLRFDDHFTLRQPSSDVTFQGESVHIYDLRASQVQMKILSMPTPTNSKKFSTTGAAAAAKSSKEKKDECDDKNEVCDNDDDSNNNNNNNNYYNENADDGDEDNHGGDGDGPFYYPSMMTIEMKDVHHDRGAYLSALRLTYTIVALFCMATFFVFSFLVILFLFMDLVSDAGLTGEVVLSSRFIGTMLAIPVFLYGFSSLLTVWGFFVMETWNGFPFLRTVANINEVVVEWISLVMMLGTPIATFIISLLMMDDQWWRNTMFAWYISVAAYFTLFTFVVVYYETEAAWLIVHKIDDNDNEHDDEEENGDQNGSSRSSSSSSRTNSALSRIKYFLSQAVQRTQDNEFCGHLEKMRMSSYLNSMDDGDDNDNDGDGDGDGEENDKLMQSQKFWRKWYTKMSLSNCCLCMFEKIDPPEKVFCLENVLVNRWFTTRNNWSIEKSVCTSSSSRNVVVVRGPNALKQSQIISTIVCIGLGIVSLMLVVFGFLRWFHLPLGTFVIFFLLIGVGCIPRILSVWRFVNVYRKHTDNKEKEDGDQDDEHEQDEDGIYQSFEAYRVSRPTRTLRIVFFLLHYGLLYLYPIVALIAMENYPVLYLFLVIGVWASLRYWFDPCAMMQYHGNFDTLGGSNKLFEKWKTQSRIRTILLNVTRSHGTKMWSMTFLSIILVIFALAIGVIGYGEAGLYSSKDIYWETLRLLPRGDFVYPPQNNLRYPTCSLINNVDIFNATETTLIDYNFLSTMIYQAPETQQQTVDEWFGPGIGKIDVNDTLAYRKTLTNPDLHVSYDIVQFGSGMSIVTVRGSLTAWEWLTDLQLWAAVGLMQLFLAFLPAGELFNPNLVDVLAFMSFVQVKTLKESQLNTQTTGLIDYMRDTAGYDGRISITGHSLGGGIALITGAQTSIPAIAISGPNNIFSRKTFNPELDLETINTMLFNVIPERDIIPMFDKPGLLTQRVACRAKAENFIDCHHSTRTLCELMYTCGSYNRPPPCDCAVKHGYPVPKQTSGDRTFSDICGTKRTNDGKDVKYFDD